MEEPLVVDTGRLYFQRKHLRLFELEEIYHSQALGPLLVEHLIGVAVGRELQVQVFEIHGLDRCFELHDGVIFLQEVNVALQVDAQVVPISGTHQGNSERNLGAFDLFSPLVIVEAENFFSQKYPACFRLAFPVANVALHLLAVPVGVENGDICGPGKPEQ